MTIACAGPNPDLGVAIRLAAYLDCQARAFGENGFQALAGGPLAAGLLSGLVTIFVALIGYRLILGGAPDLRDGVGWAARLGIVLALATGWPAFQTLFYRVAVDGPGELATVLMPAAGLPGESFDARLQQAYDTVRLGTIGQLSGPALPLGQPSLAPGQPLQGAGPALPPVPPAFGQLPQPQTASLLVITTAGTTAALRVAAGILLAIGPLAIMALLFDATLGLFVGWLRALASAALAQLAAVLVTAVELVAVEAELAHLEAARIGAAAAESIDPQGLATTVGVFGLVMLAAILAASRTAGAFRLASLRWTGAGGSMRPNASVDGRSNSPTLPNHRTEVQESSRLPAQTRVTAVSDALAAAVRRERIAVSASGLPETAARRVHMTGEVSGDGRSFGAVPLGATGRRTAGRRTRSAARRDRI